MLFRSRLITVQASYDGPTKSGELRHVPILDALLPLIQAWRLKCPGEFVFPSEAGTMLVKSARVFQEVLHRVLDAGGFESERTPDGKTRRFITFHCLRHTFASLLLANGEDVVRVSRLLGHASPTITLNVYAHMLPKEHYGTADRLSELVFGSGEKSASETEMRKRGRSGAIEERQAS